MKRLPLIFFISAAILVFVPPMNAGKRSRSDRDINAIGKRRIVPEEANWYSPQKEAEFGKQYAAAYSQSVTLHDPLLTSYIEAIVAKLAQNSDADMPITIQVVRDDEPFAVTLMGGYQYVSRGLLVRLESECELASVLARGIAHTALHTAARQATRRQLAKLAAVPLIFSAPSSGFMQAAELDADYFGVQYLYKAGYDAECFIRSVQRIWPATPPDKNMAAVFSPFPPLSERLNALRQEISDVLPQRDGSTISTPEFENFRQHLLLSRKREEQGNTGDIPPKLKHPIEPR